MKRKIAHIFLIGFLITLMLFQWCLTTGATEATVGAANVLAHLPDTFIFASGAGGWSTEVHINADGTFSGLFYDADMGDAGEGYPNGTAYECHFRGSFKDVRKISDYEYSMQIASLTTEGTKDEEKIVNGVKVITADPYGFDNAGEFRIYLPGRATADLSEQFLSWVRGESSWTDQPVAPTLPFWALYNVGGGMGFYSYQDTTGIAAVSAGNPQTATGLGTSSSHITGTITVTHTKPVAVRNRPGEDGNNLYRMNPGETYPCVGQTGTGWYKVFANDYIGYVPDSWVSFSAQGARTVGSEQTLGIVQITSNDFANIRTQPNQDADWLAGVSPGITLDCIEIAKNGWYCVVLPSGEAGYVSNKLCDLQKK